MKKIFFKYYEKIYNYYPVQQGGQTSNFELQDLFAHVKHASKYTGYEQIQIDTDQDKVVIWNSWDIKKKLDFDYFKNMEDYEKFHVKYFEYYNQRWDDMSKCEMSVANYDELFEKWDAISARQPEYVIMSYDKTTDHYDIEGKDELSEQDLADMQREHELFLKYSAAYDKYLATLPEDYDDERWYGPQDSFFEADWKKFLAEEDKDKFE